MISVRLSIKSNLCQLQPVKPISQAKIRALVGSNNVNPMTKDELAEKMREQYGSPEKQARVKGYSQSTGM